jgi:hypothetical protein
MTIREYVSQKLRAFNLTEAALTDFMMSLGMPLDDEYTFDIAEQVGKAMASSLEELVLAPRLSNVNESGFSMSWDFADLGKYYLYLCKKWGVPVNDDVVSAAGTSAIIDKSSIW